MAPTLLQTKLFAPSPDPTLIPRPQLVARLTGEGSPRLILVAAPAGSGKTTLVASWLRQHALSAGWLSLDAQDDDVHGFIAYVAGALQAVEPGVGDEVLTLLGEASPPPPHVLVRLLVNELSARGAAGVVVLDDYHVITEQAVHDALAFLVEHLPPGVTPVVISRSDPPLRLARLRAHGQLREVRAADLRFGDEEAALLIRKLCDHEVDTDAMQRLVQRTEGWAAGLQLAGLALRHEADPDGFVARFAGTHTFVSDFLTEEVLRGLPSEHQAFLVRTAPLTRLCAPLCDAVLGRADSGRILEQLGRANLFLIPLDGSRTWYRYHHLFADLLRRRFQDRHGEQRTELLGRASRWAEDQGYLEEAVAYAFEAGDDDQTATLLARHGLTFLTRGEAGKLARWLDRLPGGTVEASPDLAVVAAGTYLLRQRPDRMVAYVAQAQALLSEGTRPHPEIEAIEGHLGLLAAGVRLHAGDSAEAIEAMLTSARDALPPEHTMLRAAAELNLGNVYALRSEFARAEEAFTAAGVCARRAQAPMLELYALQGRTHMLYLRGALQQARRCIDEALGNGIRAEAPILPPQTAILHALDALVCLDLNDVGGAFEAAERAAEAARKTEDPGADFFSGYALVRVLLSQGAAAAADRKLTEVEARIDPAHRQLVQPALDALRVRIWYARRDLVALQNWLRLAPSDRPAVYWCNAYLTQARAALGAGDATRANQILDQAIPELERSGATAWLVEGLILQAIASAATTRDMAAQDCVGRALERSATSGTVRVWADEGAAVLPLLQRYVADAGGSAAAVSHASRLVGVIQHEQAARQSPLASDLSEREHEVLRLLAAGHTNSVIADQLFLAVGTVKKHTHTIYQKLGVNNRTQAVTRAQELHLL